MAERVSGSTGPTGEACATLVLVGILWSAAALLAALVWIGARRRR